MTVIEGFPAGIVKRRPLFPHQAQAVAKGVRQLKRVGARGLMVAATGTGKTVISARLADELFARLVLFVVPTKELAAQTALAWRADGHLEHMVIVSSMDASARADLVAARVGSTGEPEALAALLSVVGDGIPALTVICTYDSLDKIEKMRHTKYRVPAFDLAIMDEAHRIAGRADKKWAAINNASRILADRRLYMTATPRAIVDGDLADSANLSRPRPRRRRREPDLGPFTNSMDNEAVYGKKFFEYPLATAVADGRAADYRIVVPTITDADLRAALNLPAPGAGDDHDETKKQRAESALRTTALHLAVLRAMTEHNLRRILVYFNLVSDARRFARELPHTLRLLRRTSPELCPDIDPDLFFVHGEQHHAERADILARFASAPRAIMTNARLITEGIDIPSVDAIAFADPTRSIIRCSQALGRSLRLDVSGKIARLIIPVYVPPGADPEDILGTAFEPVWAIASALASHDHRILERLPDKSNRLAAETSQVIDHRWHFDFTVRPEHIARAMDLVSFDPRDTASRTRRAGLASAQSFHDIHGHLDVPTDYTDAYGYTLGTFITTMREAHAAGRLGTEWIAELDALGMIWDKHQAAWRARLTTTADYHQTHGHLAAPATTPVGAWLAEQRSLAAHHRLDEARAADIAAIDPHWRLPYGADWHRKYHLLRRHLQTGRPLTLDTSVGSVNLGSWTTRQLGRWTFLEIGQRKLLEAVGITSATSLGPRPTARRTFAQTVQLLELFLHRERRAPTAREAITVDGDTVKIGPWFAKMRTKHRAGRLDAEHERLVAALFDGDWTAEDPVPAFA